MRAEPELAREVLRSLNTPSFIWCTLIGFVVVGDELDPPLYLLWYIVLY